ncbi:hypothetical protein Goari_019896 [Gossypium aridum]|uniref:RNase H type-1 domain-containing protein n=1 Tax=Gossypium aridum TaxID=34290 RepID=A0A7J8WU23_GOSAI|nr:hypothetical protein [Gossypium aridum]
MPSCPHLDGNRACLNTDGSIGNEVGFVAVGGIARNRDGEWILGFNRYLGNCSVLYAEFWGILDGLVLLIDCGYNSIFIQTDNIEAVKVIQERPLNGSNFDLIRRIYKLLTRISH